MKKMFLILGLSLGVFVANAQNDLLVFQAKLANQLSTGDEQTIKDISGLSPNHYSVIGEDQDTTTYYGLQGQQRFTYTTTPNKRQATYFAIVDGQYDFVTALSFLSKTKAIMEEEGAIVSKNSEGAFIGVNGEEGIIFKAEVKAYEIQDPYYRMTYSFDITRVRK